MLVLDEALYYSVPRTTIRILFFAFFSFFLFWLFSFRCFTAYPCFVIYLLVDLSSALYLPFLVLARLGLGLTSHSCFRIKVVFLLIKFFIQLNIYFIYPMLKLTACSPLYKHLAVNLPGLIIPVGHCTLDSTDTPSQLVLGLDTTTQTPNCLGPCH